MALADILKKIEEETELKVSQTKKEAELKLKEIEEEGNKNIKNRQEQVKKEAERNAEKIITRARFENEQEAQGLILKKKHQIVDEVFSRALEKLGDLDGVAYEEFLGKLYREIPDSSRGSIHVASKREEETKKFFSKKNVPVGGIIESIGGFVFKSPDMEIDNTFESLIKRDVWEKTEMEIIDFLFSE
ncbi:MAG: hypothetical protein ABIG40_00255 [Parcubacteria group bacterium]